ncbi:MAG: TraY domain-containing protein [Hyphomicrobiales bacterium]|jgi:RHH-type rel operon transcriptional repressor/antitoxin RelB|nr:TraY domain-containing protein [Hyphomicrobiales bacterium]
MLEVQLPPDIEQRLDALAKRTGRSKSDYAREVIIEHLGDLEDADLARQRVDDIRAGREKTIPLSELMAQNGLDD